MIGDLKKKYKKTLKKVIPSEPVCHSKIFEMVHKMSRIVDYETFTHYFVHLHITTGVLDDFQNVIKELERNSKNPVSIIIIKLTNKSQIKKFKRKFLFFTLFRARARTQSR